MIGAFQAMLDGLSLLCLLAGVFIVYNTSATAVMQRARDLAIMLAVGAERRRIFLLVLTEAALLGLVASLLGVALGLGMARVLLQLVAQSMGVIYQTRFTVESYTLTWDRSPGTAPSASAGPSRRRWCRRARRAGSIRSS